MPKFIISLAYERKIFTYTRIKLPVLDMNHNQQIFSCMFHGVYTKI